MDFKNFDAVIDARTPAEYALDHIPGAVSAPVLDDAQRAEVGTLYKQVSPFEAKKLGARAGRAERGAAHRDAVPREGQAVAAAGLLLARRQALGRHGAHPARGGLGRATLKAAIAPIGAGWSSSSTGAARSANSS